MSEVEDLSYQRSTRERKADIIGAFMFELHEREEPIEEFSIRLWSVMIDFVIAKSDKTLVYKFKNETEFRVEI